ncbi:MAG: hypothetical protein JWQ23_4113 [Herminiimonas sp.]|nr:hypothetical protein [Herminiimonas sp.]
MESGCHNNAGPQYGAFQGIFERPNFFWICGYKMKFHSPRTLCPALHVCNFHVEIGCQNAANYRYT